MPYRVDDDPEGLGCWVWTGHTDTEGRPNVRTVTSSTTGARFVWERMRGPLLTNRVLHRLCENVLCVNPDHHEPITRRQLIHRMGLPVLNRPLAERALVLLDRGLGIRQVARLMGVSEGTVRNVRDGTHWAVRESVDSPPTRQEAA